MTATLPPAAATVRHFRQVLLWPLQLVADERSAHAQPWQRLAAGGPWHEVVDEVAGGADGPQERHYSEFVTFLPYVQRFLYGEGRRRPLADEGDLGSPMRVFRRADVARVRLVTEAGAAPVELQVKHVDLHFFYDLDIVLLNVEVFADDLTLAQAQELSYRFGRGYPSGWREDGQALHSLADTHWLDADGQVLARSDARARADYLRFVADHRAPRINAHWAWVLQPLVSDHSPAEGALRYRLIEYYRMPTMVYLAVDNPQALSRADFIRLGLVSGAGQSGHDLPNLSNLPYAEDHLADFEAQYCYDRFFGAGGAAPYTRYMCCGHALVVVGSASSAFFRDAERGVLGQFRHQHAILFLIAHVQKAALLMFSDRLVDALKRLDVGDAESVKRFKRSIRRSLEGFLRFTHRYWFHEISGQAQCKAMFALSTRHLDVERLYHEVRQRTSDMHDYLDADSLRRQANTVVRLTVVTILGLVGTISTGFLGMNLIASAEEPLWLRMVFFTVVLIVSMLLTGYGVVKSKHLSDLMDVLSDDRLSTWEKLRSVFSGKLPTPAKRLPPG